MNKTTQDLVKNIEPTIRKVDRRQKHLVTLRLVLFAVATFGILLFIGLALDYLFAWRSPILRWAFPLIAFTGTMWLGAKVLLSLARREELAQSVRDIDAAYPALEERWSTVTNLSASKDSPAIKGSPELLSQVATEASGFTKQVHPTQVVSHKSLATPGFAVLFSAVALLAIFLGLAQFSGKLSQRFFSPWKQVTLTQIQDTTSDSPVARGTNLDINANITGKVPKNAQLVIRDKVTGEETTHSFELKKSHDLSFTAKKITSDFSYQILSGDRVTPWRSITVLAPPEIILTDFRLAPPDYTRKEPVTKDELPFKIRSVEGSQLQLTFTSDQDLQNASLLHESRSKRLTPIPLKKMGDRTYQYQVELAESFTFRPVIVNHSGLENVLQPRCQITIFKDLPPTVKLLDSSEDTALDLEDTLEVEFAAKDDYGIAQAELIVQTQNPGEEPKTTVLAIDLAADQGEREVRRTIDLPLEDFNLIEGSEISYSIKVHDSRGLNESKRKGEQLASEQSKPSDPSLAQNENHNPNSDQQGQEPTPSSNSPQSKPSNPSLAQNESNKPNSNQSGQKQNPSSNSPQPKPSDPSLAQNGQSKPSQAQAGPESSPKSDQDSPQQSQQGSSSTKSLSLKKDSKEESPEGSQSSGEQIAKRQIDVKTETIGATTTSVKKVKIAKFTKLEDREKKDKLTIPIESALAAFQQQIESALTKVDGLTKIKELENLALSVPELEQAYASIKHIDSATKIAEELTKKTRKTPYAFAGRQLQDIAATSLASATSELKQASTGQKPLAHFQLGGSHLQTALNNLQALRKQFGTVKAEREKALALREIKEMFVLYMEDMPLLLGGDKKSPYSRSLVEIDREAAEAMQEMLDRKAALYQKIAEILKDHPELQARLMSQKRDQAINIRAALFKQQEQQTQIEATVKALKQAENDEQRSEALFRFIQQGQGTFSEQIALFIDRSTTWLPLGSDRNEPVIQDYLAATHTLSIQAQKIAPLVNGRHLEKAQVALDEFLFNTQLVEDKLDYVATSEKSAGSELDTYIANRRSEIAEIKANQKQLNKDLISWSEGKHGFILAAHQIFLKNQTAQLQAEIELNAASFLKEHEDIALTHHELQDVLSLEIVAVQENALNKLGRSQFKEAVPKLAQINTGYTNALTLLDRLVYQIIDVLDADEPEDEQENPPQPNSNKKRTPQEVTEEEALAELMALVEKERGYLKSFGIPCCRPTNVEVLKDWEKKEQETKKRKQQKPQEQQSKEQLAKDAQARKESEARKKAQDQAKSEAAELAQQAQKAQQQANQRARQAAQIQSVTSQAELTQLREQQDTSNWNTLPSELRDELLQQRGQNPPKQYEDTIQDYFRAIAEDAE